MATRMYPWSLHAMRKAVIDKGRDSLTLQTVIPSAPPGEGSETKQYAQLYPNLPADFQLTKISEIEKQISDEVEHYRLVLKKYKKVRKVIKYSVAGLGFATTVLSLGAVATSLIGVGIVVGAPLGAVGAICGVVSTTMTVINKKIERKVNKHTRIHAMAVSKHDSINVSVSQALNGRI